MKSYCLILLKGKKGYSFLIFFHELKTISKYELLQV